MSLDRTVRELEGVTGGRVSRVQVSLWLMLAFIHHYRTVAKARVGNQKVAIGLGIGQGWLGWFRGHGTGQG